ncbi:glutathione transport system permease protein GsiC [Spirochaetia bacterium]|nr:glutathione transport system permease protein GsiC [Spirochaetia bacterium]
MAKYIAKRLLQFIPVFFGVTVLVFFLMRLAPGDAARLKLNDRGMELSAENLSAVRSELNLHRPIWIQYGRWLGDALKGELGRSIFSGEPVKQELVRRFSKTLYLTLPVMLLVLILALPLGILAARFQGKCWDHLTRITAIAGMSIPSFCLALVFILVFSVTLRWLPSFGSESAAHFIMPTLVLTLASAAHYTRFIRSSLLEELSKEYVRAGRARGIKTGTLILSHGLRNALIPIVTSFGMNFALLLGGQAVVEKVFSWPGMGSCLIDAVLNRDYPLVQGCVLLYAFLFSILNLVTDILCMILKTGNRK